MFLKFLEFLEDAPIPPRLLTRTWVDVLGFGNPARAIISICLVVCNQDPTAKQGSEQDPTAGGIPQWESHLSTHVWVCPGLVNRIFSVFADLPVLRNQGNFSCRQAGPRMQVSKKICPLRWPPCPHSRLVRRSSPWSLGSAPPVERRACSTIPLKTTHRCS